MPLRSPNSPMPPMPAAPTESRPSRVPSRSLESARSSGPAGRRRGLIVAVTVAGLVAAGLVPAQAAPVSAGDAGAGLMPAAQAVPEDASGLTAYVGTVTLITGDRVIVRRTGGRLLPQVEPGPGREGVQFATASDGKRLMVVPSDAQAGISTGRVDGRLFDVAGLIEDGYGDDRRAVLPLLMTDTRAAVKAGATTTAATTTLTAVRQPKARTNELWPAVRKNSKVWLDGLRKPTLDRSTVQIGAPVAWQAGYTGQGVTIAVLDTGIDAGHPDFRGRIAAVKNFTDESGTRDQVGHGTHVASTVAGSGAGSDGKYKGVAPDAKLLIGKVCAVYGCPESAILAGMEWAAKSGAKAVNLSLGGPDTPGIDPLEQAVQDLSATYKTLFVIAAGNDGRDGTETVGSPASADAALAVGAVDRDDTIADFSSRGPRIRDAGLKPEIVAPGVGITAAKVGGGYTSMSGTSMATPHVTGAAAILAGQHPDWTGAQLKAALMGSAQPVGAGVYEQGAGRVDVGRAVGQTVTAEPAAVSIGRQAWPHEDDPVVTRTLTYRNPAATAQTLSLTADTSAPAGMFTLSSEQVTVPAGGQASVTVTVDTAVPADEGAFGAWITATGAGAHLVTPVAVDREPESYDLTVRTVDTTGSLTSNQLSFIWGTDLDLFRFFRGSGGEATLRVRRGVYHLDATVNSARGNGYDSAKLTMPSADITADTTITFDARDAKPVSVTFARPGLIQRLAGVGYSRYRGERGLVTGVLGNDFSHIQTAQLGDPAPATELAGQLGGMWALPDAHGDVSLSPVSYNLSWFPPDTFPTGFTRYVEDSDLARVETTYRRQRSKTRATKVWVARDPAQRDSQGFGYAFPLPMTRTEFHNTDGVVWSADFEQWSYDHNAIVFETALTSGLYDYQAGGSYTEDWNTAVFGPGLGQSDQQAYRTGDVLVFQIPMYADATANHAGTSATTSARTILTRDGTAVGESTEPGGGVFDVPATTARYRLETTASRDVSELSTRQSAVWTFSSEAAPEEGGKGKGGTPLPLMTVRFAPPDLSALNRNGDKTAEVPVTVTHQPGATVSDVTTLTVEQSTDDGTTWTPVPVNRTGAETALATVTHPRGGRFISLRTTASDAAGNTVDQTVIRAYEI